MRVGHFTRELMIMMVSTLYAWVVTLTIQQRLVLVTRVGWGRPHYGVSTTAKANGVVNHSSGGHLELLHHEDLLVDVGLENGLLQEL